ncbi:protein of unknown function [Paraburkholderia kururiensis]
MPPIRVSRGPAAPSSSNLTWDASSSENAQQMF